MKVEPPSPMEGEGPQVSKTLTGDKKLSNYASEKAKFDQATRSRRKIEREKAKAFDLSKKEQARRSQDLADLRARTTEAREIPLQSIFETLGVTRDPADKNNFRSSVGRFSVSGAKFHNHTTGKGGGGAIDLTMALLDCSYREAMAWLSKNFSRGAVLSNVLATAKTEINEIVKNTALPCPLKAHQASKEAWPMVRDYLVEKRGLSVALVDEIHSQGLVHADKYKNCCFVLGPDARGLSLRGTGEKPFHGLRGEKAPFILKKKGDKKKVVFVESPIDALSLREIGFDGEIVATMGNASIAMTSDLARHYRQDGWEVFAGFDADKAGDNLSKNLGASERMRPRNKDWNSDLLASQKKRGYVPTPQDLDLSRKGPAL